MEFILVFFEFYFIKRWRVYWVYILLPIILGFCIYNFSDEKIYKIRAETFHNNIINFLGILIGFSISALTIILSVENENIKATKKETIKNNKGEELILYSCPISLYESVTVELVYIIIVQGLLLIANFTYPSFVDIISKIGKIYYSINVSIVTYCILLLMQNILNLYFIFTKKDL